MARRNLVTMPGARASAAFNDLLAAIPERDPATFMAFKSKFVTNLGTRHSTRFAFAYADRLAVAGGILWFPGATDDAGHGHLLGLDTGYAQLSNGAVLPRYRGRGLQRSIIEVRLNACDAHVVIASAASTNPASVTNLQRCGFVIADRVTIQGNERHLMVLER